MATIYVPLDKISLGKNPFPPLNENTYGDLRESIAQHGILQPLLVSKVDGTYRLQSGYHRYKAAQELLLSEVPVEVVPDQPVYSYITDICRRQLKPSDLEVFHAEYDKLRDTVFLVEEFQALPLSDDLKKTLSGFPLEFQRALADSFRQSVNIDWNALPEDLRDDVEARIRAQVEAEDDSSKETLLQQVTGLQKTVNDLQREYDFQKSQAALKQNTVDALLKREAEVREGVRVLQQQYESRIAVLEQTTSAKQIEEKFHRSFEKEQQAYQKELTALRKDILDKQEKIDQLNENNKSIQRTILGHQSEAKAAVIMFTEHRTTFEKTLKSLISSDALLHQYDSVASTVKTIIELAKLGLWSKETIADIKKHTKSLIKALEDIPSIAETRAAPPAPELPVIT